MKGGINELYYTYYSSDCFTNFKGCIIMNEPEFTDEEIMQLYTDYLNLIDEERLLEDQQRAYQWEQGLCVA